MLIVLDNVSDSVLLSPTQLGELPQGKEFHYAATTRLGENDFLGNMSLTQVPIGGLSKVASVELIRLHQPDLTGDDEPDFRSTDDEAAAGELADLLDGFTLAVELAAIYLMTNPEMTVREYLDDLKQEGVTVLDEGHDPATLSSMHHKDKLFSKIVDSTVADLEATVPGATLVLQLAAAMPPENVAWVWLETLTREIDPSIFERIPRDRKGRWRRIRRTLEGRGLIDEGRHRGHTGRIHRLLAEHLADPVAQDVVDAYALIRARTIGGSWGEPEAWELDTLLEALSRPIAQDPDALLGILGLFQNTLARFVTYGRPRILLDQTRSQMMSGRVYAIASAFLGSAVEAEDPVAALALYQEALTTCRDLASRFPNDLGAQRNLSIALENVARLKKAQGPNATLALYEEALSIRRDLVTRFPNDLLA